MLKLSLTSTQLCELVDMPFKRFETLRRRSRETLDGDAQRLDVEAIAAFPVRDAEPGKWTKFDLEDALQLACCLELERAGLDWPSACRLVLNAGARDLLNQKIGAADFWISRTLDSGGAAAHANGTFKDAHRRVVDSDTAVISLNASAVARALVARAVSLNLAPA